MRWDTLDCNYSVEFSELICCNCDFPYCVLSGRGALGFFQVGDRKLMIRGGI